jgi:ribosomal protein S18 acetylase RimI-like enzyme
MGRAAVIDIRDASVADLEALAALWAHTDALHARLLPRFFRRPAGGRALARQRLERLTRAADEVVRVAVQDAVVVGLCHLQVYDTPPQPALTPCRRVHIDSLVVAMEARRRGIGRRLLDDAIAWGRARGASEVVLTVWEGNAAAEKFYQALGFTRVSSTLGRPI